jgi:hypothetical protein
VVPRTTDTHPAVLIAVDRPTRDGGRDGGRFSTHLCVLPDGGDGANLGVEAERTGERDRLVDGVYDIPHARTAILQLAERATRTL